MSLNIKSSTLNWRGLLLPLCALLAYWALLIHQLGAQWSVYAQYSYGWAVPALCAYLIWQRVRRASPLRLDRGESDATLAHRVGEGLGVRASGEVSQPHAPRSPHLALLLLVFCALLYAPTRLLHEANPIWRLTSWLWTLEVIAITLLLLSLLSREKQGAPHAASPPTLQRYNVSTYALAFPICFFLVAVPWPTIAERWLVDTLTGLNVVTTIELLNTFGIPALQHGNVIEITTGVVGVDEACSGIRSFQATLMLSLFFGELYSLTVKRRMVLCLLGFAASFAFNVGRTFILTYVASKQGVPAIDNWHDPAGITILVWCFVAIWFASLVMKGGEAEGAARQSRNQRSADRRVRALLARGLEHADKAVRAPGKSSQDATMLDSVAKGEEQSAKGEGQGAEGEVTPLVPSSPPRSGRGLGEVSSTGPLSSPGDSSPASGLKPSAFSLPPSTSPPQPSSFSLQPSAFRLSGVAFGLIAWLVLVEVGVQLWYRSHEKSGSRIANWALRTGDSDSNFTRIETPETVLRQFNADENTELRWHDDLGATWQLYYFRWLPAASLKKRVAVQLAKTHGPEKCLPAAGMKLSSSLGIKQVEVNGMTLALQHYVFGAQGQPVHVFYAIYEDSTGTVVLANRRRDVSSRVAAALSGSRNYGQRFLEVAVWGIANEEQATAALQRQLEKLIRVEP